MFTRLLIKPKFVLSVVLNQFKKAKSKNKVITSSIIGLICYVNRDLYNTVALCDEDQNSNSTNSNSNSTKFPFDIDINDLFQTYIPSHINELSMSSILGICTGIAFKRVGRTIATGIGSIFILIQTLQHYGYIDINFNELNDKAINLLDADGDGKLTMSDVQVYLNRALDVFAKNMPSATAFSSGLSLGLFWG